MKDVEEFKATVQMLRDQSDKQGIEPVVAIGAAVIGGIINLVDAINHQTDAADTRQFGSLKMLLSAFAPVLETARDLTAWREGIDNAIAKLIDDYNYLSKQVQAVAAGNGELGRNIHELRQGIEGQAARIEAIEDRLGEIATILDAQAKLTEKHIAEG